MFLYGLLSIGRFYGMLLRDGDVLVVVLLVMSRDVELREVLFALDNKAPFILLFLFTTFGFN